MVVKMDLQDKVIQALHLLKWVITYLLKVFKVLVMQLH